MVSVKELARHTSQNVNVTKAANTPESKQWLDFEADYKTRLSGRDPNKKDDF